MNVFSQKQVEMLLDEVLRFHTGTLFLIKVVNACFQQLRNFRSLQQCDIILRIKVLNIGHLFRTIQLIGHADKENHVT